MKPKSPSLGKLGAKFFSWVQMHHKDIVRLGDLQKALDITATQEHELLKRLTRSGLILRLMRGIYLVPDKLPAGGYWQPSSFYLVAKYMEILNANYYISGLFAFHYYGLITQIPNEITIYNDKRSCVKRVGVVTLRLIKISNERIGGFVKITDNNKASVNIASLARTMMDAVYDWKKYNSLPQAYEWISLYKKDAKLIKQLIKQTAQHGNIITIRRIGYCIESLGLDESITALLQKKLISKTGWVLYNPVGPKHGKTNKRWRIIYNENIS